ncbi:MAG: hypothetical protein EOM24_24945 [Chloroflexia bacterium]|nr:hypothetical protein [Chloroflexia bacterium]
MIQLVPIKGADLRHTPLAPGRTLSDLRAGQLAQGIAANPAGCTRVGRVEALRDSDGCLVQLGAALADPREN